MLGVYFLFAIVGTLLIVMSSKQPFPDISKKYGVFLLLIFSFFLLANQAERIPNPVVSYIVMVIVGGIGTVVGMRHVSYTKRDVLVAPFSGVLMTIGTIVLLSNEWRIFTTAEQISAFVLIVILISGMIYLLFKTLLIGELPQAWSQAGLRQLHRGLIEGERGAISCFEKAWDSNQEHLNAMAYIALNMIHLALGNNAIAEKWNDLLMQHGGRNAVDSSWINSIEKGLIVSGYIVFDNHETHLGEQE